VSDANNSARIFAAPTPRVMEEIFDEADLSRLRAIGEVIVHDHGVITETVFDEEAADATIIIGQIDLPESRLRRTTALKAVFNVEGNFLPNVDYGYCFRHGIRVLNISPVFAQPVAEAALGMAINLCRGISRADRRFREGTEQYGLAANSEAISLYRQDVGLIGLGDVGKAILPLLLPFGCRVRAYDPWLPAGYIQGLGCESESLETVLRCSRAIFIVAGVTSQNQGLIGAKQFALMQQGSAVILVSRAAVIDFDAALEFAEKGHIRFATDVFPHEPLPAEHPARQTSNLLLCGHQAGALPGALKQIGKLVVADAELITRGLPPILCKAAQPETVGLFRSQPVGRT
jgi:phosphoglycerate dehydrogenase-like enzyme